jgi:prolyl oligopeptidase
VPRPFSFHVLCVCALLVVGCATTKEAQAPEQRWESPPTAKGDVVEDLHGEQVADPYRWLEDSEAPAVRSWIEGQNAYTSGLLDSIADRTRIKKRMTHLWDYERFTTPWKQGGRYFWYRNDGLQAHSVLYTAESPSAAGRVLIDPNTFSEDGTVALSGVWPSEDGTKAVYSKSDAGTDWRQLFVLDVVTGEQLSDHLKWIKFSSVAWTHDGAGFFYARYDAPEDPKNLEAVQQGQKLYYHRLGTAQSEDQLVLERPDKPRWGFSPSVTEDGSTLVIYNWEGTEPRNRLFYVDLSTQWEVTPLLMAFDARYSVIGKEGSRLFVKTDNQAPRGRVISFDISKPEPKDWAEVLPETEHTLTGVGLVGEHFIVQTMRDAHSHVAVHDLNGGHVRDVDLPGIGTASGFGGKRADPETFYSYTSFLTPGTIYRYDVATGASEVFRSPSVEMDQDAYTVEQVFYPSKDGTRIPMFLVYAKGMKRDGSNPTYLYGYGGFNIAIKPRYSTIYRVWLEMGGVVAIANLRGGGEYGKAWHDAGRLKNKQNVFDDFHAAAQWLTKSGITRPDRLGIGGRSNGGLLVGAAITQRPELYGAALPGVGVLDMLRFHKFTIGWAWTSDYGSPDEPEMFKVLRAYSPLHNVEPGRAYPATLVTTGDHDDRVVPGHSFKFAAALQAAQGGKAPIMIRIETRAGHGAGKPTKMRIEEWTDQWSFLAHTLRMKLPADF